jgi:cobalt/nickel transport system permease protein
MHIPDGFLDLRTAVTAAALAGAGLAFALRDVRRRLPTRRVPLIGLAAAFVFAAQMINFPVAAGTSGHLIGAALVTVLLGPGPAVVAMTAVLLLQSLMFADGGITALGANVLNLAVIAPAVAALVYALVRRLSGPGERSMLVAAGCAAWCSTLAAALACAAQLAASGIVPWTTVLPAMGAVHLVIGLAEAVITMLVLAVVLRARPDFSSSFEEPQGRRRAMAAYGVTAAIALAVFVAPFASSMPDGLEHVAEQLGFAALASEASIAPLPDYSVEALANSSVWLSTVIAGGVGTLVVFGIAWLLARALTARPPSSDPR